MIEIAGIFLLVIYSALLFFILLYSFVQANLVINYLRFHKQPSKPTQIDLPDELSEYPYVTIQLPVYNEKYVIGRLIDSVASIKYPADRFEIQVLDDSTDETVEIAENKIKEISARGISIVHIRRKKRIGYKAGALAEGLELAKGELIAVFDSDFVPKQDFLLSAVPYFADDKIGVVQTRWEHINKNYSLLTKLQAFALDAHFSIEQTGRNFRGHFINFNGTAGIWRKECIVDAGGWSWDTLTEDLDLSYRAQLKGWKFKYLEGVGSPAELPPVMSALKTQQFRWTKGAAECARKNLWSVLKAENISINTKIHAFFHLMNSFLFVCIIVTAILSIPVLLVKHNSPELSWLFKLAMAFLVSLVLLLWFYWVSFSKTYSNKWKAAAHFAIRFPIFLAVSMGMSLHNGIAVIEGYSGKKTPFIRTPKMNLVDKTDNWNSNQYLSTNITLLTMLEGLLMLYFLAGIYLGIQIEDYGLLPMHLMLSVGFGYVFFSSVIQSALVINPVSVQAET